MLVPIDQYKKQAQPSLKTGKLKPLPMKQKVAVQPVRPDIKQSPNYLNAVSNADRYSQEAQKASSFRGMAVNALKAVPRATVDTLVGTPVKFAASVAEVPSIVKNRQFTDKTYKFPGLTPFKSFQSQYGDVAKDVVAGKKGMGSAAWALAQVPLAGLETGVGASGIARGLKALAAGNVKNAGAIVSDAFLPTNFSKGLKPLPPKVTNIEAPQANALPPMRSGTQKQPLSVEIPTSGQTANQIVSKSDSYTGNLPQKTGKVNQSPLLQEAKKYSTPEEFEKSLNLMKWGKVTGIGELPIDKLSKSQMKVLMKDGLPENGGSLNVGDFKGGRKITQPIEVSQRGSTFVVENGRHRLFQALANGDKTVPVVFKNGEGKAYSTPLTDLWKQAQGEMPLERNPDIASISQALDGTEGGKQRGFIESVKNSPEVSQDLASRVKDSRIDVQPIKPLQEEAQRTIFNNINEAERIARNDVGAEGGVMNTELIKHYDSIAQQAKKAGDNATFEAAMNKADDIVQSRARNLTDTARNLNAAKTVSDLSPEGLLHYINKISRDVGAPIQLSNDVKFGFMRRAEVIQNIIDPRERAFKTFDLIDDLAEQMPRGKKDQFLNVMNLPRAIMSTADLSAPLRQGIFTAARHPITFGKNFGKMFKYAFSEDSYRGLKADIITSPNYNLYVKHKLPLTDISAGLTGREEAFMSNLAEKIPLFGKLAKGSNRAYTGFLNKMRVDLFDDFVKTAQLNGIKDQKYFDDAAKFVGAATGRGNLFKTLEGSAPALNSIFFSPRLMASRLSLINPHFYMKLEPTVRKEALKSLGAFVGTGMSILALAKANGADVSVDPRSADFGKIKMGNTRYDIWGGFQQYARLIGQLATGEKVSTITGRETTLGQGYNAPTRESIFMDFLKSKEAPIISLLTRASQGEKYGEKFNLPAELVDRFLPMVTGDAFDLYSEYGAKGVVGAAPGFFGVGSQTYGDQVPTMGTTEAGNPTVKFRTKPGLGETILNTVTGNEVSTIPKDQWGPLYEERKQEQIRQAEVDKVKQIVLISGETQYVGDTKIYLENGVVKTKKESKDKRLPLKDQLLYDEIQKRKVNQPFYTK